MNAGKSPTGRSADPDRTERLLIGGEWTAPDGGHHDVLDPATEEIVGRAPEASTAQVRAATEAARAAFGPWSRTTPELRARVLDHTARLLRDRLAPYAELAQRESGATTATARGMQVGVAAARFARYARGALEPVETPLPPQVNPAGPMGKAAVIGAYAARRPVGVVACITSYNNPWANPAGKIAPALAMGNTVVVKPAPQDPLSVYRMAEALQEALEEAGAPPGVVNVVSGTSAEVGAAAVAAPETDMVSFTGSTAVGRAIAEECGRSMKRQLMELGGKGTAAQATFQNPGVFGGIVMGFAAAWCWQRLHRVKLVDWLGFFNGRRLVPIVMAFVGLAFAAVCLFVWPPVGAALTSFSKWLTDLDWIGSGIFGTANRALLVVGLHQFLNTFVWFQFGDFTKPDGTVVHGDINRFLAGDPTAGQFTTGFFPIMMFALPAAALAITHCARPGRRKEVGGLMLSVALTSFVTGVTEPIEYSFVFIAPVLYGIHAVLTGASLAVCWALGVHDSFSFSAGLIDYVINWGLATKPWLIIPIGLCFAALYYALFRFVITKFDLATPGREPVEVAEELERENVK
nr:aldehyde dehydrogenase family protein [Streptomyces benahoarensis]